MTTISEQILAHWQTFFARYHRKDQLKQKLVVNFACVSNGDHYLLVQSRVARKEWGKLLQIILAKEAAHEQ